MSAEIVHEKEALVKYLESRGSSPVALGSHPGMVDCHKPQYPDRQSGGTKKPRQCTAENPEG